MRRPSRRDALLLLAILAVAVLIRRPCLRTELWFDEVWSLKLVREAGSLAGVLFGIHHDNSHPLNSLWLWAVGTGASWTALRFASFAFGLLTVGALSQDREDPSAGLLAAALAAVCAPMVLYSTEARGYAGAMACAVVCRLLLPLEDPPAPRRVASFALFSTLGFFSHATFLFAFAGLAAWAWITLPPARRLRRLLALFAPAPAVCAVYLALQWGPPRLGNGAHVPFGPSLLKTLAQWSGAPDAGALAVLGAAAVLALCGWELARLRREKSPELAFFAALFALNLAFFAALPYRYERYLAISLPFALLLASRSFMRLLRKGGAPRGAAVASIALALLGGGVRDRALATAGRGHYLEAMRRMAAGTPGPVVTVAGDHHLRVPLLLEYYGRFVDRRFEYVPDERRRQEPADWYLLSSLATERSAAPVSLMYPDGGASYALVDVYPYAGMSGWSWWLYRRDGAPSASAGR